MRRPYPDRQGTLRALAESIRSNRANGNWRGVELATAAWHRVHGTSATRHESAGLALRLDRAADRPALPADRLCGAHSGSDGLAGCVGGASAEPDADPADTAADGRVW